MKSFILLFTLFFTTFGFSQIHLKEKPQIFSQNPSQRNYRLVNELGCDLLFYTNVVKSDACNKFVSNVTYFVAAHSSVLIKTKPDTELRWVTGAFAQNNCVGMYMSPPPSSSCGSCPPAFGSSGTYTSTCSNLCFGKTIKWKWFENNCSKGAQLVYSEG